MFFLFCIKIFSPSVAANRTVVYYPQNSRFTGKAAFGKHKGKKKQCLLCSRPRRLETNLKSNATDCCFLSIAGVYRRKEVWL